MNTEGIILFQNGSLQKREDDFFKITRRLKTDKEIGFFAADYYGKGSQEIFLLL